jgi:hypothetical protein
MLAAVERKRGGSKERPAPLKDLLTRLHFEKAPPSKSSASSARCSAFQKRSIAALLPPDYTTLHKLEALQPPLP